MIRLYSSVCHALVWWLQKSHPRWSDCHLVISYKMIRLSLFYQLKDDRIALYWTVDHIVLQSPNARIVIWDHHIVIHSSYDHVVVQSSDFDRLWSCHIHCSIQSLHGQIDIQGDQMVVQPSDDDIIILLSDDQIIKISSSYQMIRLQSCHPRWSDCAAPSVTPCCLVTSKTSSSNCFQLLGRKPCLHMKPN